MEANNAALVYFSPTGSTKKVLGAIARGMGLSNPRPVSMTHPEEREFSLEPITEDVLLIGVPVYGDRVPELVLPCLRHMEGLGQPAVIVSVYGNVGAGIALEQLAAVCHARGFPIIAGAAFVGEHTLSHGALPIAADRPDARDLALALEGSRSGLRAPRPVDGVPDVPRAPAPGAAVH